MVAEAGKAPEELTIQELRQALSRYAKPNLWRAMLQLFTAVIPYFGLWIIMVYMVKQKYSAALIIPLIFLASFFLVRIFIFFHDCAHNSFFASRRANTLLGYALGILTFTPFKYWQHNHLVHHNTYADLDKRGVGDIWTLTIEEYRAASPMMQLGYRFYRNPLVFLGIGPGYIFLLTQRMVNLWEGKNERFSAAVTNLALIAFILAASQTIGIGTYLLIQLPVVLIAGSLGVWLFYVQHQFEGVYWSRHKDWDPVKAALKGSSYYQLPRVLQWFSGNIGLHHIHHVLPRIPNYNLQKTYDESTEMQAVRPLTFHRSLKSLYLNLWDEKQEKLVNFKALKE